MYFFLSMSSFLLEINIYLSIYLSIYENQGEYTKNTHCEKKCI